MAENNLKYEEKTLENEDTQTQNESETLRERLDEQKPELARHEILQRELIDNNAESKNVYKNIKKNSINLLLIFVIFIFPIGYGVLYLYNISEQKPINKIQENIHILKSKYPNQTDYFWTKIETRYHYSIFKGGDPSIVLMVSDNLTSQITHNLSFDILNAIFASSNNRFINNTNLNELNSLIINPNDYKKDSDNVKLEIDYKLESIFLKKGKVALIKGMQYIPAQAMLLFFSYGDIGSASEYPGVIILMTLQIDVQIEQEKRDLFLKSSKEINKYTEIYLSNLWSTDFPKDKLKPLFSRIGNNILFLN